MYNKIFAILKKLLEFTDWQWVHVKIGLKNGKNSELYLCNPDYKETPVEVLPTPEAKPETLAEKITRMRTTPTNALSTEEETWFKDRQKELEFKKIGQILPEDSIEVALQKLEKIGVK